MNPSRLGMVPSSRTWEDGGTGYPLPGQGFVAGEKEGGRGGGGGEGFVRPCPSTRGKALERGG